MKAVRELYLWKDINPGYSFFNHKIWYIDLYNLDENNRSVENTLREFFK